MQVLHRTISCRQRQHEKRHEYQQHEPKQQAVFVARLVSHGTAWAGCLSAWYPSLSQHSCDCSLSLFLSLSLSLCLSLSPSLPPSLPPSLSAAGNKQKVLALNGSSPDWNHGTPITVKEQDPFVARQAAAKPIAAAIQETNVPAGPGLTSKSASRAKAAEQEGTDQAKPGKRGLDDGEEAGGKDTLPAKKVAVGVPGPIAKAIIARASSAKASEPAAAAAPGLMSASKRKALEEERRAEQRAAAAVGLVSASKRKAEEAEEGREGAVIGLVSASKRRAMEMEGAGRGTVGLVSSSKRSAAAASTDGKEKEAQMREAMLAAVKQKEVKV
jgi:hypothetical protein